MAVAEDDGAVRGRQRRHIWRPDPGRVFHNNKKRCDLMELPEKEDGPHRTVFNKPRGLNREVFKEQTTKPPLPNLLNGGHALQMVGRRIAERVHRLLICICRREKPQAE